MERSDTTVEEAAAIDAERAKAELDEAAAREALVRIEDEGGVAAHANRYGGDITKCPFLNSMGAAGIELARQMEAAEAVPEQTKTIAELLAERQAQAAAVPAEVKSEPAAEAIPEAPKTEANVEVEYEQPQADIDRAAIEEQSQQLMTNVQEPAIVFEEAQRVAVHNTEQEVSVVAESSENENQVEVVAAVKPQIVQPRVRTLTPPLEVAQSSIVEEPRSEERFDAAMPAELSAVEEVSVDLQISHETGIELPVIESTGTQLDLDAETIHESTPIEQGPALSAPSPTAEIPVPATNAELATVAAVTEAIVERLQTIVQGRTEISAEPMTPGQLELVTEELRQLCEAYIETNNLQGSPELIARAVTDLLQLVEQYPEMFMPNNPLTLPFDVGTHERKPIVQLPATMQAALQKQYVAYQSLARYVLGKLLGRTPVISSAN